MAKALFDAFLLLTGLMRRTRHKLLKKVSEDAIAKQTKKHTQT